MEVEVAVAVYWLACGASYRVTADAFGMPLSTVCRTVYGVVEEMMAILHRMTKTGKPDSYWRDLCIKYAQGLYRFSTGKRPGAKKWKKALENIDACPLQSHSGSKDLFGRSLQCSCGFHKVSSSRNLKPAGFTPHWSPNPLVLSGVVPPAEAVNLGTHEDVGDFLKMPKMFRENEQLRHIQKVCPWSQDILSQLDVAHRSLFPAVLTTQLALDRKAVTFLKPRTSGNSSSYVQSAMEEAHSEEWARQTIRYLSDCERHKKMATFIPSAAVYLPPPTFRPLPLAQWFETVHSNDILSHLDEMKGVITSTYDHQEAGWRDRGQCGTHTDWTLMSNIGNELGQVLNSVLTSGEGAGLEELCQGVVTRYKNAGQAEPEAIYVDRDCCSQSGVSSVAKLFHPWQTTVRLDSFHFMRRFNCGLTTEHHPLYGIFCAKLSSCIFAWDQEDVQRLKEAKREEWKSSQSGHTPTEEQLMATISPGELKRHCRRRTRGVEETRGMISGLLESVWELTDTTGLRLVSHDSMRHVWEVQQKHLECLQDPAGVALYTKVGTLQKGGKELDVLRCGRGSSSLESFHKHQCAFIPGWRCNAVHTQMYMLEGVSRWNMGRAKEAVDVEGASTLRSFDVRLMSHLSNLSQRVLGSTLVPEFTPPGKPTSERIAVEYLLAQTNRGDLLAPNQVPEVPSQVLEEEDEPDDTISMTDILCQSAAIGAGDPPGAVVGDAEPGPLVTQVQVLEAEEEPDDTISMTDHTGDPPGAVEDDDEPGPLVTEITRLIGEFIVDYMAPFNIVENRKFIQMFKVLEPKFKVPCRGHFSEKVIPEIYNETKQSVKECLKNADCIALTTDGWTSRATQSYITITAQVIDEKWESKSFVLQTHNASNMDIAVRESGLHPHIKCLAHVVNLASKRGLAVSRVARLLGRVRRVTTFFHKSTTATAVLANKQPQLELPRHKLITDVQTRWNSTYEMLARYLEQQAAVSAALSSPEIRRNAREIDTLDNTDISDVEDIVKLLKPLKTATTVVCDEKEPTVSLIMPLKYMIEQSMSPDENDTQTIANMKSAILRDISDRYSGDCNDMLQECTALDPRFRSLSHLNNEQRESVYARIREKAAGPHLPRNQTSDTDERTTRASASTPGAAEQAMVEVETAQGAEPVEGERQMQDVTQPPPPKKTALEDLLGSSYTTLEPVQSSRGIEMEIVAYRNGIPIPLNSSPLEWWKVNAYAYPILAPLAKAYLCIPATSVPSERVFSTAGDIVCAQRSLITPEHVDMLVFLKKNQS
ncbi:uncharacterized protein LOC115529286 [Gadus morhua]|nr:uncharacterized protein LOC115529286 [Gadus morhua]